MFVQDAVIMLDRLTIELRIVTKVDVLLRRHAVLCWRSVLNICGTACYKFMRIIAIPISKHVSHSNPAKDFNACASSVLLYHSGESKTQRKWFLDEKRDGLVDENRVNNKENKNNRAVFMLYLFAYNIKPMPK